MLGAGGVLGGAWLTGGLSALARETDWDPGSADYIVGTSAGSMIGALVAAGVPPWFMVAHSRGEVFDGLDRPGRAPRGRRRPLGGRRRSASTAGCRCSGPGSLRMAATALSNPLRHTPLQMVAGWLPAGLHLHRLAQGGRDAARCPAPGSSTRTTGPWPATTSPASRTPFGRAGSPRAEIADAVAASCAIPGFYRPVKIGGRRYVDGGVCSVSNLDLLAGRGLDLVICLNPLTCRAEGSSGVGAVLDLIPAITAPRLGGRLEREERKVRASAPRSCSSSRPPRTTRRWAAT